MSKKIVGTLMAFAVVLSACGSSSGSTGSGGTSSTTETAAPAPGATTLTLASTSLGQVVADSKGMVLYLYLPDGAKTESTVAAGVLQAWPAVPADGPVTLGPGLTAKATTGTQPDGAKWVMYNGHLLYGYVGDSKPGDVNGNGLANVWYTLSASGERVPS